MTSNVSDRETTGGRAATLGERPGQAGVGMMIRRYFAFADGIARAFLRVTMVLMVALIVLTVLEVGARYIFAAPTIWSSDIVIIANGSIFMLAAAFTLLADRHVRIDILATQLPFRIRRAVEIAFYAFLFLPAIGFLAHAALVETWKSFVTGEEILSAWRPLQWPFFASLSLGVVALWIQGSTEFLRNIIEFVDPQSETTADMAKRREQLP